MVVIWSATFALPQTASDSQELGLIISTKPPSPVERTEPRSSYSQFVDPVNGATADDLVRYALAHNGELAAARQVINEARGRLRQAGLRPNPMIEASGARALTSPDNNFMLGAELPLELGGRRRARLAVAARELELRDAEVADFERRLAGDVRLKYADAIAAARNLKFIEDLLDLTRSSHRLITVRVERGKSAPLEQNVVLVELGRVDAMRIGLESKAEITTLDLKKLIGMPPDEPMRLRGEFGAGEQPIAQSEALSKALRARPDLLAARAAEDLASAQIEQARIEGKVDASIFANYQRMNSGFDVRGFNDAGRLVPVQQVFHFATFGVKLALPLRNKNQGNIDAALANLEAARARRQYTETIMRNEIAAAYARWARAQSAVAIYRDNVRDQALRNLDVVRQTYVLGQKSVLDYVAEQRRFIDVETGYTEVLKEYIEALVEIDRAVGGK